MNDYSDLDIPLKYINCVCRVCLTEQKLMIPIHEINFTHNLNIKGSLENVALSEVFFKYCNVVVHIYDKKPQKICESCMNTMCTAFNFFELFRQSNALLDKRLKRHGPEQWEKALENHKKATVLKKISRTPNSTQLLDVLPHSMKQFVMDTSKENYANLSCPLAYFDTVRDIDLENNISVFPIDQEIDTKIPNSTSIINEDKEVALINGIALRDQLTSSRPLKDEEIGEYYAKKRKVQTPPFFIKDPTKSLKDHTYALNENMFLRLKEKRRKQKELRQRAKKPKPIRKSRQELRLQLRKLEYENDIFRCTFCRKTFQGIGKVLEHLQDEHPLTKRCILCPNVIKRQANMIYHVAAHSKYGLVCRICRIYFQDKESLERHKIETDHSARLTCKICNKTFKSATKKRDHIEVIHAQNGKMSYQCSKCGVVLKWKCNMKRHELTHEKRVVKRNFLCQICGKQFTYKQSLKMHVQIVHEGIKHQAPRRTKKYIRRKKPKKQKETQIYKCEICSRTFSQEHVFFRHCISHPEYKSVTCPYCKDIFENAESYVHHRTLEHKTHVCDICNQGFPLKTLLSIHVKSHEKRFKCAICDYGCTTTHSLENHKRVHTGERPYKCDLCDKAFKQQPQLTAHIMCLHTQKNHKCKLCEKTFNYKYGLKAHMRSHAGIKPFVCPYCQKSFRDTVSRHKHVKRDHSEKMKEFIAYKKQFQKKECKEIDLKEYMQNDV